MFSFNHQNTSIWNMWPTLLLNSYDLSELSSQVTTPRRTHNTLCWKQAWNLSSAWQLFFFRCSCSEDIGLGFSKTLRKKMQRNVTRKKKFVKMFQNDRNGCHVSDLWCFEFPHCCIRHCGSGQAVGTAAVLYFSIDPSLHVEHLELSRSGCRKHRECFCRLCGTELFEPLHRD